MGPGHRLERLRTHLCVNNSRLSLRGGLVGRLADITGLLAQFANLGGTCDPSLKFDILRRTRGPQQPLC